MENEQRFLLVRVYGQKSKWNKGGKEEGGSGGGIGIDREIRGKDAKKDEIGTSLVNLNNYMTWAQGYDLIISKLQFHAFRQSTN